MSGLAVQIPVQDYKSLRAVVRIYTTLVNTHRDTDTHTHTHTERERERERERAVDRLYAISSADSAKNVNSKSTAKKDKLAWVELSEHAHTHTHTHTHTNTELGYHLLLK